MTHTKNTLTNRLRINQLLVQKNRELVEAIKNNLPYHELTILYSQIQELYNHASHYKLEMA